MGRACGKVREAVLGATLLHKKWVLDGTADVICEIMGSALGSWRCVAGSAPGLAERMDGPPAKGSPCQGKIHEGGG